MFLPQFDNIARKSQEDREVELKELETEYQGKLGSIVEEIEEKWREKKATLEEDWAEKFEKQREDLQTSYRDKYQKERESLGRQMREKYEKGVEHARKKLEYQFKVRRILEHSRKLTPGTTELSCSRHQPILRDFVSGWLS